MRCHIENKVDTWHVQPKANPGDFSARSAYVAHIATEKKKESFYTMHTVLHVTGVLGVYLKRVRDSAKRDNARDEKRKTRFILVFISAPRVIFRE